MAICLGIDFETNGLNPDADPILEIGYALWDSESKRVVNAGQQLYNRGVLIPNEMTAIHRIDDRLQQQYGLNLSTITQVLVAKVKTYTPYLVAHNAAFERNFIGAQMPELYDAIQDLTWIDTKLHLPCKSGSLVTMCAEHGFLNPYPHEALPDVMAMLKLLGMYDFNEVVKRATAQLHRITIAFAYNEVKVKAIKELSGYKWDGDNKVWFKDVYPWEVDPEVRKAIEAGFQPWVNPEIKEVVA